MKKKWLAVLLCLAVSVSCLSLVACGDKDKDGGKLNVLAVSETEYDSAENALKGYVANELAFMANGYYDEANDRYVEEETEAVKATYNSNESKGEIKLGNVTATDAQKQSLVSVEKFVVSVRIEKSTAWSEMYGKLDATDLSQTVYVAKYGDTKFHYVVAKPENGERACNTYIKVCAAADLYKNCESVTTYSETEGDQTVKMYMTVSYSESAVYEAQYYNETRFNNRTPGHDAANEKDRGDREYYYFINEEKLVSVCKRYRDTTPTWQDDGFYDDYATVAEYAADNLPGGEMGLDMAQNLPGVLFTATKSGLEYSFAGKDEAQNDYSSSYKVTIEDGKVTKLEIRSNGKEETGEGSGTFEDFEMVAVTEISKFGTVAVTVPDEAKAALGNAQ